MADKVGQINRQTQTDPQTDTHRNGQAHKANGRDFPKMFFIKLSKCKIMTKHIF